MNTDLEFILMGQCITIFQQLWKRYAPLMSNNFHSINKFAH
jgi:hypothetical protein